MQRFSAVMELRSISASILQPPLLWGDLDTADPFDSRVKQWWMDKAKEVFTEIPNFGGFLVKADSEGRPGPYTYNRTHADGANMLAEAVEPFGGKIIWRCFVYNCQQDWRDREPTEPEQLMITLCLSMVNLKTM